MELVYMLGLEPSAARIGGSNPSGCTFMVSVVLAVSTLGCDPSRAGSNPVARPLYPPGAPTHLERPAFAGTMTGSFVFPVAGFKLWPKKTEDHSW